MNKKSISAVIFVFNESEYIGQLIESIVSQTYKVDKIIMCDDQSADNTKEVILEHKSRFQKVVEIVLLENENKGKTRAYQKALMDVDTELFFVCGGDDVIKENYVLSMINGMEKHNVKFIYSNQVWVDSQLNFQSYNKKKEYYTINDLFYGNYAGGFILGYSELIKEYTPFPEGLTFEDWYVALYLAHKYGKCYINNEQNYLYRRHSRATTYNVDKQKKINLIQRDIDFFKLLIKKDFYKDIFEDRIIYYEAKINKKVSLIKVLLLKNVLFLEKLKAIVIRFIRYY